MSNPAAVDFFVLRREQLTGNTQQQVNAERRAGKDTRKSDTGMTESITSQDPFDLTDVRDHQDYTHALAALAEQTGGNGVSH